jgi:cellulose synthase/poly-beta-1,6-N-acetylglucosamine synthase-like glycosyltransferase
MVCEARKEGIEVDLLPVGLSLVYTAREGAVETFLSGDYDSLLFVDSDMVTPPDLLTKLIKADKDIVSALAFKRFPPYEPCIFKELTQDGAGFYLDYSKGLIKVAGVGMACTLIKRKVLEELEKPLFYPNGNLGEDLSFCLRAKARGFEIFCDTQLICGHVSIDVIKESHYRGN